MTPYILVVDDEAVICDLIADILDDEGYEVGIANDGESARKARRQRRPDLILLDIWMPDIDGITLLKEWAENDEDMLPPIIMMSGHGTVETAVEATRHGAYDFLEKPLSHAKLLLTIEHALNAHKLLRENKGLRKQIQPFSEPLGKSEVMLQLREEIKRIASHETWVLFFGEVGSGKAIFARYLHQHSTHQNGPFIELGVAALNSENSANELFGYEDDEHKVHYGLLEQANGGTLYIDDIGDMDLATQARLLSALETRSFHRVGGTETIKVNVRIIAATHYQLDKLVQQEKFRSDLYYQLNVVPINIPPLYDHREDVPELLNYYLDYFVQEDHFQYRRFSMAALNRLRNYDWPGNLLELKNLVQRLLISSQEEDISLEEVENSLGMSMNTPNDPTHNLFNLPLREAREKFEKTYLEHKLKETDGSVGKVAQLAGMERTHLYRKLRSLGIDAKQIHKNT